MLKLLLARIKDTDPVDLATRALNTFWQAGIATFITGVTVVNSVSTLKALAVSSLAAGVAAIGSMVKTLLVKGDQSKGTSGPTEPGVIPADLA